MNWEWVERLGALAMVCVFCWWMMKRADARDNLLEKAFDKMGKAVDKLGTAVDTFAKIEQQNRHDHQTIIESLNRVEKG